MPAPSRVLVALLPLLLVAAGGCAGTLARYGLSQWEPTRSRAWPWGTFLANVIGAFVLGILLEALARRGPDEGWRQRMRLLAGTGFCGALTTFSSVVVAAAELVAHEHAATAVGYLALTTVAALAAVWLGLTCGRAVAAAGRRERA